MDRHSTSTLENLIHYTFTDDHLLDESLRHSSFVNEMPDSGQRDNERLEFLGDSVLNLIIGHILLTRFSGLKEGDLSRMRASLVNEQQLARLARSLNLGGYIKLGKGEAQTGGYEKNSILAGALEALFAAIYLDGGFERAFDVIRKIFLPLIGQLEYSGKHVDFKSLLQEFVQARPGTMPSYSIIREEGPDHDKIFWVRLEVLDVETQGMGKSKKAAEQDAARKALSLLKP
jgi:ribonuclease III